MDDDEIKCLIVGISGAGRAFHALHEAAGVCVVAIEDFSKACSLISKACSLIDLKEQSRGEEMNEMILAAFGMNYFMSKLMPKHYIGGYSGRPYPRPVGEKKKWKLRRQHGTGRS